MSEVDSVGVVSVATNQYLEYWFAMAQSADQLLYKGHEVVLHVFTDRADDAREMARSLTRVKVDAVQIEPLGWPDATLLRYEVFNAHREHLNQDLLMHLDADMLLVEEVGQELEPEHWRNGIALVRHPGLPSRIEWRCTRAARGSPSQISGLSFALEPSAAGRATRDRLPTCRASCGRPTSAVAHGWDNARSSSR